MNIVYPSAQENANFATNMKRPESEIIPPYQENSRVVRGSANPEGSGPFGRAYTDERNRRGEWMFSKEEMKQRIQQEFPNVKPSEISQKVTKVFDLPQNKNNLTDVNMSPGSYGVEISYTLSGSQQIRVRGMT